MKIWRYMDLAKFITLLSRRAIYFANPNQFEDPFEFRLPLSHQNVVENIFSEQKEDLKKVVKQMIINKPSIKNNNEFKMIENRINDKKSSFIDIEKQVKEKFCVSCWHINDDENDALWKIYTNKGQGIAIETTSEKLEKSLTYHNKITFDRVRYEDFNTAPIEKGHKNYSGFIKRKAFSYEKEFRAVAFLDENYYNQGCSIDTDLNTLIEKIHISPFMPKYFLDSVRYLCEGELSFLKNKVVQSKLYDK